MNTEQHDAKSPNAKRHKRIDAQQLQLGLDESPPSSPVPWQSVEFATYLPDAWLRQYLREHPMRCRKHLLESESRGTLLTQYNYLSIIDASKVRRQMCDSAIGPWIPSAGFQHWVHTGLPVGLAREAFQLMPELVKLLQPRMTQFFPDLQLQVVLGPDKQAVATMYEQSFNGGCWESLLGWRVRQSDKDVYCTLQLLYRGQLQCATSVKFHGGGGDHAPLSGPSGAGDRPVGSATQWPRSRVWECPSLAVAVDMWQEWMWADGDAVTS